MEALLELEKVQRVLSFMSSRGLSDAGDGGAAADRFLAQFILFLVRWSSPSVPPSPRLLDLPFPPRRGFQPFRRGRAFRFVGLVLSGAESASGCMFG
jgi:hypothetical protein